MPDFFSSRSFIGSLMAIVFATILSFYYGNSFLIIRDYITKPRRGFDTTTASPYFPTWNAWFDPSHEISHNRPSIPEHDGWNLYYHLGGYGPWIEKLDSPTQGIEPPAGCYIDQVHMMARHGERYPTKNAGSRHLDFLKRIKEEKNWPLFRYNAFTTGTRLFTRYRHLLPTESKFKFWASDSQRVIETARYFALGLLGLDWENSGKAELEIIPETFDRRADTLTPGDTCRRYLEDTENGHDKGVNMLARFLQSYVPAIAERLLSEQGNSALGALTNMEIFSMQEMCGFETLVRGSSPWCNVFNREDWENFEYARDLVHYYRAGPGNPYAGAMGWLWLNATEGLLQQGPGAGPLFFSFVHDGDIAPFLEALDVMQDPIYDPDLPTTYRADDRIWRTSSVLPMGGRIILERMTCSSTDSGRKVEGGTFIRVNINDKIVPLPYCKSGPGMSCPLGELNKHVERRNLEVGNFAEVCGVDGDVGQITFLKQQ